MADSIDEVLAPLNDVVGSCDPSALDTVALRAAAARARELQRAVDALLMRIARRSDELAARGDGPDACEVMLGTGEVSARQARTDAARSVVAATLPEVSDAAEAGRIGGEHLDVIAIGSRGLDEAEQAAIVEQAGLIAAAAASQPVDVFNKWFRQRVNVIRQDHGRQQTADQRAEASFRHWRGRDGMGHFRGTLDPQRFDTLTAAIDRHMRAMANQANTSAEVADGVAPGVCLDDNLAAAALVELVSGGNGRHGRAEIKLVVDAATMLAGSHEHTIAETSVGTPVPPETIDRYACAADIQRVVVDQETLETNVGRKYRTATEAQWSALVTLYSQCGWFGCDRPIDWCQAHHVITWDDLGLTDLDNLLPLCNRHHHAVHEGGWRIELDPDRTVRLYTPDGVYWNTAHPDRLRDWLTTRPTRPKPPDRTNGGETDPPPTQQPQPGLSELADRAGLRADGEELTLDRPEMGRSMGDAVLDGVDGHFSQKPRAVRAIDETKGVVQAGPEHSPTNGAAQAGRKEVGGDSQAVDTPGRAIVEP